MGSCGTKCPKEHYNRPISVHNTHKVLEESDGGEDDQQNIAAHSNRNSYKNKPHNQHNQYDSYQPNIQTQPAVQSMYIIANVVHLVFIECVIAACNANQFDKIRYNNQ